MAASALTLTLPAGGANLYHHIVSLQITRVATAALVGSAALVITSTNLPGSLAWTVGNAMAAGATQRDIELMISGNPLRSVVANTPTTIVMPAPGAAVLWRAVALYYLSA